MSIDWIEACLNEKFAPEVLELHDWSHRHGSDEHSETLKPLQICVDIQIVAAAFEGKSLVHRHRMIYEALDMANTQIHGLTIQAHTPQEWALQHSAK